MAYSLTILTPTYNRAYTLSKLYESLLAQTNKNFIWMVIDDGSTDNMGVQIILRNLSKNILGKIK